MKQINGNYLEMVVSNNQQQNPTQQQNKQQQILNTGNLVNATFANLGGIFTAWKHAFTNVEAVNVAKNQWLIAFREANITAQDVQLGLRVARHHDSDFIPSVGKFIGWIKQEKLKQQGIPDVEEIKSWWTKSRGVKLETLNCSEQVYWVLVDINKINKNPDSKELIGIIKQARQNAIDKLKRGEPVPKRELTLENKPFEISVEPLSEEYKSRLTDGLSLLKQTLQRGKAC